MNFFKSRAFAGSSSSNNQQTSSSSAVTVTSKSSASLRDKDPAELVQLFRDSVITLVDCSGRGQNHASDRNNEVMSGSGAISSRDKERAKRASEVIGSVLARMKVILSGEKDADLSQVTHLANEIYAQEVLGTIIANMGIFEFEAKRDSAAVLNLLLRRQIGSRFPTVDYVTANKYLIFHVLKGYDREEDVALNTGLILREMLRHEALARILLYSDEFYLFPGYIDSTEFGLSCDAFANMRETLTRHKGMVAGFLESNYDRFFTAYRGLILSPHYVTRRQSLKLLGEIILDRSNYNVMTRYIASTDNLKLIMEALRDKSKNIQFEAFHVFKVFVANPHKPPNIVHILKKNQDKLLRFLTEFHRDRDGRESVLDTTDRNALSSLPSNAMARRFRFD